MTGQLLGSTPGEKPKQQLDAGSSDDEKQAMLPLDLKREEDSNHGLGWRKSWGFSCCSLPSWIPQRAVLCVFAHLGFVLLYIMRSNMSVAIVLMTKQYSVVEGDQLVKRVDFDWSLKEQGCLLSSFFIGYILTQIPGGYFAVKWGGRRVFGLGLLLASIVSIFTPICGTYFGYYGFLFARILCGVFEGVTYPAIHAMWNHWAPPAERTSLVSFAFSGAYLGAAISMAQNVGSGSSISWQDLFYISGFFSLLWSAIWFSWGAEYPEADPMVSERERQYLAETVGNRNIVNLSIPWTKILLSPRVWAINICHFAANWGFYTILTELPTFLTNALNYDDNSLASVACLPFLAMAISAAFGGCLIDKTLHRCLNTTITRKVTVAITFLAQMMFFFLAGKAVERVQYIGCIVGALFFGGLSWAGFSANHLDIAPDYASVLLGISNTIGTIPGILSPVLTGYFVEKKEDVGSWSVVFVLAGYIYLVAAGFYVVCGSGERQDWADSTESVKLNVSRKQSNAPDAESASE